MIVAMMLLFFLPFILLIVWNYDHVQLAMLCIYTLLMILCLLTLLLENRFTSIIGISAPLMVLVFSIVQGVILAAFEEEFSKVDKLSIIFERFDLLNMFWCVVFQMTCCTSVL